MRVSLQSPPWGAVRPTPELLSAIETLADGVWAETAVRFYGDRAAKLRRGKRAPKGMQAELNAVIAERMLSAGWIGRDGRFARGGTWIRITFRHQMSLGSDLIDALRMCRKEDYEQAAILAADNTTLKLITPNDAAAVVSFEKLRIAVADLDGVIDIPLLIGCLTPTSEPSQDIKRALNERRPRDITVPVDDEGKD